MQPLLTAAQMRLADEQAIHSLQIPSLLLMEHAAMALVQALRNRFGALLPKARGIVLAGPGNNGGDVVAATRLLRELGCEKLFVVRVGGDPASTDCKKQWALLAHWEQPWGKTLSADLLAAADWVLDGLLGTGLKRPVEGEFLEVLTTLQSAQGKWILSADVPSGLNADTGHPLPVAVRASQTITFGFYKRGLVTAEAAHYVGELKLATIQIPRTVSTADWSSFLYTEQDARRLPQRRGDSHKGQFGKVLILGGPPSKEGAAALSALGALRAGAGLVTVAARQNDLVTLRTRLAPEIMTAPWSADLAKAPGTILAVGPGLGVDADGWKLLEECLGHAGPLVLDADALNLISAYLPTSEKRVKAREATTVLTPHPKEAAALLSTSTEEIEKDRYASASRLASKYGCWVVLKGSGTLCTSPGLPVVAVRAGDSGLSKGGSGDVLSGVLAALLAQGLPPAQAVPLAVFVHGRASQLLTRRQGQSRSTLASEVATAVADVLTELECPPRS